MSRVHVNSTIVKLFRIHRFRKSITIYFLRRSQSKPPNPPTLETLISIVFQIECEFFKPNKTCSAQTNIRLLHPTPHPPF